MKKSMMLKILSFIMLYSCSTMQGNVSGVSLEKWNHPSLRGMTIEEAKEFLGPDPVFAGERYINGEKVQILVYAKKSSSRIEYNLDRNKGCYNYHFLEKFDMKYNGSGHVSGEPTSRGTTHCNLGAYNHYQEIK